MKKIDCLYQSVPSRSTVITQFYITFSSISLTPVFLTCEPDPPFVNRQFPSNRGYLNDRSNILIPRLLTVINCGNVFKNPMLYYTHVCPYIQLEIRLLPPSHNCDINLMLNETLLYNHWQNNQLHPAVLCTPLLQHYFNNLQGEFYVRVNDNVFPRLYHNADTHLPETEEKKGDYPPVYTPTTPLFAHQAEGVRWMKRLENSIETGAHHVLQLQVNKPVIEQEGHTLYWTGEGLTDSAEDKVALLSRGGMIGDGIGSGKTLQMLSLILSEPGLTVDPTRLKTRATLVVCGKQLADQWRQQVSEHFKNQQVNVVLVTDKLHHERTSYNQLLQADLIIVTMSFLLGDYYRDVFLAQRSDPNIMPISKYHNALKTKWPSSLSEVPVLELLTYRRLILDEADMYLHKLPYMDPELESEGVYNRKLTQHCRVNSSRKSEPFLYMQCLHSDFRWLVTSTANFREEAQQAAFVSFLNLQTMPLKHTYDLQGQAPRTWAPLQPLSLDRAMVGSSSTERYLVKQAFLEHLLLARSQEYVFSSMALPDVESQVIWIEYSDAERNLVRSSLELTTDYDERRHVHAFPYQVSAELQEAAAAASGSASAASGGNASAASGTSKVMTVLEASEHMLEMQRRRLAQMESRLVQVRNSVDSVEQCIQTSDAGLNGVLNLRRSQLEQEQKSTEQAIDSLNRSMRFLEASLNNTDPCCICLEALTTMITTCGHKFCRPCLTHALSERPRCPTCRATTPLDQCIQIKQEEKESASSDYGSRFRALLQYIQTVRQEDGGSQFVVFSEWDKELKKQEVLLDAAGYKCAQIKGNTAVCQHHVNQFQNGELDVILLSLKSMASGLHLVRANHVIILTPLGAPFDRAEQIERQAVGRCHRVGQTRLVHVRHILAANSMEETIWKERHGTAQTAATASKSAKKR